MGNPQKDRYFQNLSGGPFASHLLLFPRLRRLLQRNAASALAFPDPQRVVLAANDGVADFEVIVVAKVAVGAPPLPGQCAIALQIDLLVAAIQFMPENSPLKILSSTE